jgi:DNA-binding NtrC family response regulator
VRITIPSLRERRADIALVAAHLIRRGAQGGFSDLSRFCEDGDPRRPRIHPELAEALVRHDYPVNTRELEHILLLSKQTSRGGILRLTREVSEALGAASAERERSSSPEDGSLHTKLLATLRANEFNISATARTLQMDRHRLRRLMAKFQIARAAT